LALPAELLAEADRIVREGGARSRNEFVAQALARELAARRRGAIDAAFASMADDAEYQREAAQLMAEFAHADAETLRGVPP
jgi:metal-responsive CopG/Arc/MetJ family transcriptional regulator